MAGSHWADTESCQRSTSVTRCLPPPSPAAARTHGRYGPGASGSAQRAGSPPRSAAATEGQGRDGHRGRAAERPATEKWETPLRWGRRGNEETEISCLPVGSGGGGINKLIIQDQSQPLPTAAYPGRCQQLLLSRDSCYPLDLAYLILFVFNVFLVWRLDPVQNHRERKCSPPTTTTTTTHL